MITHTFNLNQKRIKIIGLRNIVTTTRQWSYLLFYDLDGKYSNEIDTLIGVLDLFEISYILYETKHGHHVVSMTPVNAKTWGVMFDTLQEQFPEYYSGQTIRVSRKEGETQELVHYNFNHPIIYKVLAIYKHRFQQLDNIDSFHETLKGYKLVFEKYWTKKA